MSEFGGSCGLRNLRVGWPISCPDHKLASHEVIRGCLGTDFEKRGVSD